MSAPDHSDVAVGYLHPGTVTNIFHQSILGLITTNRLGSLIAVESTSAAVAYSRSKTVMLTP